MDYAHVQRAPLTLILIAVGAAMAVGAWHLWHHAFAGVLLAALAGVFLVFAASFASLRVEDAGDHLRVRFGPLPIFGTRIPYSTITEVEAGRTRPIDGWGIHYIPWRGWTFNLWGWRCVKLRCDGRTVRIGTDDPANLERFLRARIARQA